MNNALQQYTELYQSNLQLVCDNAPDALNSLREDALQHLLNIELPSSGSEDYAHISLNDLLSVDYGLNLRRLPLPVNPALSFRCEVPNISTALYFNINDLVQSTGSASSTLAQNFNNGVLIGSFARLAEEHSEILKQYLGKIASLDNPLTALNTLLAQDGLLVYIPKGVKLSTPLQLVNILKNNMPLMAVRRVLVVMEDNAEAKILVCDHTQDSEWNYLSLQTIEIYVGKGAHFELYDLEESTRKTVRLSQLYLHQEADSEVRIAGLTLYNGVTRNEYYTDFRGKNATLWLGGIAIEDDDRYAETHSIINHNVPDCRTEELFKHLAEDNATTNFSGKILVAEGATGTEAYQQNRNILGSSTAHVYSKPQLEIYNDDVKCSHGSATGSLNELQLFYMRTRGLSEETATRLLKQAFMSDVIENVKLPGLKERLYHMIERRFSGNSMPCADCHLAENRNKCNTK